MLLNSKKFNQINFFLANKREVNSLEEGAKLYGGATLLGNKIYSNYRYMCFQAVIQTNLLLKFFLRNQSCFFAGLLRRQPVRRQLSNWLAK